MKTITVTLLDPVDVHGLQREVVFKEPNAALFMDLGDPVRWVRSSAGDVTAMEVDETLRSYMERCVQAPFNPVALGLLSLADAMLCREEFLRFFAEARARMLSAQQRSSASTSNGSAPATSAA